MKTDFILKEEVYFCDEEVFGDKEEHSYDVKCYDGFAIGTPSEGDTSSISQLRLKYPKRQTILESDADWKYVLEYCGLFDLKPKDINYGDIMTALGEVVWPPIRKDYAERYVHLREEIMSDIVNLVEDLVDSHGVNQLNELENNPPLLVDIVECHNGEYVLEPVYITDINSDGTFIGYYASDERGEDEFFGLYSATTDTLIDVYERLLEVD